MTQSIFGSPLKWTPVQTQSDANVRAIQELAKTQDSMVENFGGITKSVDEVFADAQKNMQVNGLVSLSSMPVESLNDPNTMLLHKLNLVAQGSSIGGFDNVGEYAKAFDLEKANLLAQDAERREFYKKQQEDLNRIKADQFQAAFAVLNDNSGLFSTEQKKAAEAVVQGLGKEGISVDKEGNVAVNEGILLGILDGMGKGSKQIIDNTNSSLDLQEVLGKSAFENSKYGSILRSLLKMKSESKIMGGYATQRNDKESAGKYSQADIDYDKAINIYLDYMQKNDPNSAKFFMKYRDKWSSEYETAFDKIYSKQVAAGLDYTKHADGMKVDAARLVLDAERNNQTYNLGLMKVQNDAAQTNLEAQKVQMQVAEKNDPFNKANAKAGMESLNKKGLGGLVRQDGADSSGKPIIKLDTNVWASYLNNNLYGVTSNGKVNAPNYQEDINKLLQKPSVIENVVKKSPLSRRGSTLTAMQADLDSAPHPTENRKLYPHEKQYILMHALADEDNRFTFDRMTEDDETIKKLLAQQQAEFDKHNSDVFNSALLDIISVTGNNKEQIIQALGMSNSQVAKRYLR